MAWVIIRSQSVHGPVISLACRQQAGEVSAQEQTTEHKEHEKDAQSFAGCALELKGQDYPLVLAAAMPVGAPALKENLLTRHHKQTVSSM